MNRLILAGVFAGLLALGCTSTPGTSPGTSPETSPGTSPGLTIPPDAGAALVELCDANNPAGIATVATQLENVGPSTDTTQLQSALGTVSSNLSQIQVTGEQATARDAALAAVVQAQAALTNPATIGDTARAAANALRTLSAIACN